MRPLVFDIETTYNLDLLELALEKADSEIAEEKIKGEMALNPLWGKIIAIGVMSEDSRGERIKILAGEEPNIIKNFWTIAKKFTQFVGFNSIRFDLPFIELRSRLHQIDTPINISTARYRTTNHIDLYMIVTHWMGNQSENLKFDLETVATALGVNYLVGESSLVPQWNDLGEFEKIEEHLEGDLKTTKALYELLYRVEGT